MLAIRLCFPPLLSPSIPTSTLTIHAYSQIAAGLLQATELLPIPQPQQGHGLPLKSLAGKLYYVSSPLIFLPIHNFDANLLV